MKKNSNLFSRLVVVFFALLIPIGETWASHSMGIDLAYKNLGNNQYEVTISFYRDCAGISAPSSFSLTVSSAMCGQNFTTTVDQAGPPVEVSQICDAQINNSTCQGGSIQGTEQYIYVDTVTLPMNCTDWTFSTEECCRNDLITNIIGPGGEYLHVDATLNNVADTGNNSPILTNLPVPYICDGQPFNFNHGAVDVDGDSLVFSLVTPLGANGVPVTFVSPFSASYFIQTSTGTVNFSTYNGQISFTPSGLQVCVASFLIKEYRNGVLIGSTMRDMQIIVMTCNNTAPYMSSGGIINLSGGFGAQLLDTNSATVCVGWPLEFEIEFEDTINPNPFDLTTNLNLSIPGASFTILGGNPATFSFSWTPQMFDLGNYFFTITVANEVCPVKSTNVYAFDIFVKLGTYAGQDLYLCEGDTVQLYAIGGNQFEWSPSTYLSDTDIQNPIAWPDTDFTYIVTTNLIGQCPKTDTLDIWVVSDFNLNVPIPNTICLGGSVQLNATSSPVANYSYVWTPDQFLSDDSIPNPVASPPNTTTYTVTVSHPNGCVKTKSVLVNVSPIPLTVNPTVDDAILCMGDSTVLRANPPTGMCSQYLVSSIPYSPPAAGGYTNIPIYNNDVVSSGIYIGFDFQFFCAWGDMVYVSSNGWMSFTSSASSYPTPATIPTAALVNNLIAFAWTDLNPGYAGASIGYKILGTSPNQQFILKFENVKHSTNTAPVTVYVILTEGTNLIEIHNTSINSNGTSKTQGIENSTGLLGYAVPGRDNSFWTAIADAYRFTPLTPPPYTITWYDPANAIAGTLPDLTVKPDSASTYIVQITDGACTDQKPVTVKVINFEAGPDLFVCPGDSAQLTTIFTSPPLALSPTTCGIFNGCTGTGGFNNFAVGTGAAVNSSTTWPAPYGNWYSGAKHQFLFLESELTASGVTPGTITSLAFYVNSNPGTTTYNGYTIKIKCTNITSLTAWQTGLTTVYNPKNYNVVNGWNAHAFDNEFNWDGTSNLVVEICFWNGSYNYTNSAMSPYTTTTFNSCIYYYEDAATSCPYSGAPTGTTGNRPNTRFTICTDTIINSYSWAPGTGLSSTTNPNPKAAPGSTTTYAVTMSNTFCSITDSIKVTISGITGDTSSIRASCMEICDGSAILTPTFGTPPLYLPMGRPRQPADPDCYGAMLRQFQCYSC